jgi:hypothetical protein
MHQTGKPITSGLLLVLAMLTLGCSNTYKMERLPLEAPTASTGTSLPTLRLGDPVVVSKPSDGRYGDKVYAGSGTMVQLALVSCLKSNGLDAVARVEGNGAVTGPNKWQVVPTILEWEDRATEWSGLPDRIKVEIRTIDPEGRPRDVTIVSGSSKWATLGGDHPQDMLAPALAAWGTQMTSVTSPPTK